ncbi:SH3 domain-containing protein [Neobacillus mesonae]|uniref:SH3 domain-containing protein n=1 Tax=Neobacillus mesonae TaxID=1193713 RepID=UPI0020413980|nr:SH3 domain-containing protein [Neobacillus mesonae]MCM3567389.1 SH3 domain-containing protein [Neobacillus mesonae]
MEAASLVKFSKTTYQTTANVILRSGPSTKNKNLLTIPKGTTITSSQRMGSWYQVTYTYKLKGKNISKNGWVSGSYIKKKSVSVTKSSFTKSTAVVKTTAITKTNFLTSTNVNLRSGVGTKNKIIITVKKGKTVTAYQKNGKWYKVSYTYVSKGKKVTKYGWISGDYLREYNIYTKTLGTNYFTKKTAKLYSEPNTKRALTSVSNKTGLYSTQKAVNSIKQTWYQVSYNGKNYYVFSGDVTKASFKSFAKKDFQVKINTYMYSSYGSTYSKVMQIPKGAIVSSAKSISDWAVVTYKGKTGYILLSYLQTAPVKIETQPTKILVNKPADSASAAVNKAEQPQTQTKTTVNVTKSYLVTADLNLRESGAGTKILITIPNGTTITSSERLNDGWYKVTYGGKTGYVSSGFLKEYALTDYRFIELRTKSNVTAQQINAYITKNYKRHGSQSVLLNKGQAFIDAGNMYGVNALYLAAHAIHESGFGTSVISIEKKNLFGYGAYDATPFVSAYRFSSVEQCINYVAQKMKADYLNPYGKHFEGAMLGYRTNDNNGKRIDSKSIGMNFWYASDPNWGNGIAKHMQNIMGFNKTNYENPKVDTRYFSVPGIPVGSDQFPEGIQVLAKKDLSSVIKKGTVFTMLEKSNDFKVKVQLNKNQYTLSNISFSKYKDYISALNLGRVVNASSLNIRSAPDKNIIGLLKLNQYVSLALDKNQKIITDPTKEWYQVNLSGGKTGWVSKSYIKMELQ